jgi:hypothetical protein
MAGLTRLLRKTDSLQHLIAPAMGRRGQLVLGPVREYHSRHSVTLQGGQGQDT